MFKLPLEKRWELYLSKQKASDRDSSRASLFTNVSFMLRMYVKY